MAKKKKSSKKIIRVEILNSTPSNFYIKEEYNSKKKKVNPEYLQYRLNVQYTAEKKKKLFILELKLDAFLKDQEITEKGIFGIKNISTFKVKDYDKIIDEDDKLIAPEKFIKKLLNICIGGVRGMLATNLINTELSHITLPLFDLKPKEGF